MVLTTLAAAAAIAAGPTANTSAAARSTYYFLVGTANFLGGELQKNTVFCEMDGVTGGIKLKAEAEVGPNPSWLCTNHAESIIASSVAYACDETSEDYPSEPNGLTSVRVNSRQVNWLRGTSLACKRTGARTYTQYARSIHARMCIHAMLILKTYTLTTLYTPDKGRVMYSRRIIRTGRPRGQGQPTAK